MASAKSLLMLIALVTYVVVLYYQLTVMWPAEEKVAQLQADIDSLQAKCDLAWQRVGVAATSSEPDDAHMAAIRCEERAMRLSDRVDELQGQADLLRERLRTMASTNAANSKALPLPSSVSKGAVRIFVMALTAPTAKAALARSMMRKTWLTYRMEGGPPGAIQHRFVIGTGGLEQAALDQLQAEQREYGDLALLPDFREAFQNLTGKLLEGFAWSADPANLEPFDYLFKVDDDTFVRLDVIERELAAMPERDRGRLYWGYFDGRAEVRRHGKYAEMSWVVCDRYLPYALGGGYVVSRPLVEYVAANRFAFSRFNAEDASLGLWLAPLNITRKHDTRFDTEWFPRGCYNRYVVLHKQTVADMMNKHNRLVKSGFTVQCPSEYRNGKRVEYEYNWTVLPSQCCPGRGLH